MGSAQVTDGSLTLNDIAAVKASFSSPFSVPAHSCAEFGGISGDITDGDVIEVYPKIDDAGYPPGIVWLSGTQDGDTTIKVRACNMTDGALDVSGTMPVSIYRH